MTLSIEGLSVWSDIELNVPLYRARRSKVEGVE